MRNSYNDKYYVIKKNYEKNDHKYYKYILKRNKHSSWDKLMIILMNINMKFTQYKHSKRLDCRLKNWETI